MDLRRNILIVGLAVVSYLMVLAWNEDYGQPKPVEQSSVATTLESMAANSQDIAASASTNPADASTEFTPPEAKSDTAPSQNSTSAQSSRVISVKTDVLDLLIDMHGGNIVSANLPQYRITQNSDLPLPLLQRTNERYYIAESGLFGKNGFDSVKNGAMPDYHAAQAIYELIDGHDELVVELFYTRDDIDLVKRYRLKRDSYLIAVEYQVKNKGTQVWEANLSGKLVRDRSPDPSNQNSMGMQSFLGMVLSTPKETYEKYSFSDLDEKNIETEAKGGWIAFIQHYFLSAWIPEQESQHTYQSRFKDGKHLMGFISPAFSVEAGGSATQSAKLYIGPKIIDRLETVAPHLDLTVDYGKLFWIAYPLFWLLDFLHGLVGNWGIAIILVTLIVKGLFFNLSAHSYKSMANMRRVGPKLQALKEQYGDDRQKMSAAMMELYKKENISIFGGCLPILVQMPVFIALYWVLAESVQLRHAEFYFWIIDLSVKDPYFVLPILMGISMYIQMQLNPTPPDPMQAKVMKIMPFMMTIFFLWFPSGLVLYWVVNNILSIIQQWVITRQIEGAANSKA